MNEERSFYRERATLPLQGDFGLQEDERTTITRGPGRDQVDSLETECFQSPGIFFTERIILSTLRDALMSV